MAWHRIKQRLGLLGTLVILGLALLVISCRHVGKAPAADLGDKTISLNELAGEFFHGNGRGVNCCLTISKNGAFTFTWHGCLGLYCTNYGSARLANGLLCLAPKIPNSEFSIPKEYFPLRWGARIYLVATNELVDFCNSINGGREPRGDLYGRHYLRKKDWDKPVFGMPEIPVAWAEYLISKPIKGEIVYLLNNNEAWANIGSDDGLREGVTLTAWKSNPWTTISVRIYVLKKDHCLIKHEWDDEKLEVGMKVGSRITK